MNPEDKELLRHALLEGLVARHPAPVSSAGLQRIAARQMPCEVAPEEVHSALEYLREKGLVAFVNDDLGATKWWNATAAGVDQVERG